MTPGGGGWTNQYMINEEEKTISILILSFYFRRRIQFKGICSGVFNCIASRCQLALHIIKIADVTM